MKTILGRGTSEKSVMMNLGDAGSSFEKAGSSGTGEEALWASGGSGQASKGGGSYRVNISIPEERASEFSLIQHAPWWVRMLCSPLAHWGRMQPACDATHNAGHTHR